MWPRKYESHDVRGFPFFSLGLAQVFNCVVEGVEVERDACEVSLVFANGSMVAGAEKLLLKSKKATSGGISVYLTTQEEDCGNSQIAVFSVVKDGSSKGPNQCAFIGEWEIDEFYAAAEILLDRLDTGGESKKSLSVSRNVTKVLLRNDEKSVKVKFLDQKPLFTTSGVEKSWQNSFSTESEMKHFLKCIFLLKKKPWAESFYASGGRYFVEDMRWMPSSVEDFSKKQENLKSLIENYKNSGSEFGRLLGNLYACQLRDLNIISVAKCNGCGIGFLRMAGEGWKKKCLDCWKKSL